MSASASTEKTHIEEKTIANKPVKAILFGILIVSPILGIILLGWFGFIVGIILDVIAFFLSDYAEKKIIEKTIERDQYN